MLLNNYCSVSIAVDFSQRAGNATIYRGDFSPKQASAGFYFGAKAPLGLVQPFIRQLKQTAIDMGSIPLSYATPNVIPALWSVCPFWNVFFATDKAIIPGDSSASRSE